MGSVNFTHTIAVCLECTSLGVELAAVRSEL